jgi:hypothetical protein
VSSESNYVTRQDVVARVDQLSLIVAQMLDEGRQAIVGLKFFFGIRPGSACGHSDPEVPPVLLPQAGAL